MDEQEIIQAILGGEIFIYPTDTIYGLGCNALNKEAVDKIKEIKSRDRDKPLSIIAPSIEWINEHLIIDVELEKYLPGPYTILLKKKDINFLPHVSSNDMIGIRIPDHEFTGIVQKSSVPFITTSVNLSGEPFITKISEVADEILEHVHHIIDYGELKGKPSILIKDGSEIKRN